MLHYFCRLENTEDHTLIDAITGPRYIKTHNSYDFVAYSPDVACKYIYIARNPKDVCVSLWHHARGFAGNNVQCVIQYKDPRDR